jgi:hypothetical protein
VFQRCANPQCSSQFDYRQGQLIRTPKQERQGDFGESPEVQHYWLCGVCACRYFLEFRPGKGVIMLPLPIRRAQREASGVIAA